MKVERAKRWVFTCQINKDNKYLPSYKKVENWLRQYSDDAIFQLEKGEETGRLHYQGRFTLRSARIYKTTTKQGSDSLKNQIDASGLNWKGFTFAVERDETKSKAYCSKSKTRIKGPWRIGTEGEYVGRDLGLPLRPWQQSLKDFVGCKASADLDRTVISVYDPKGNAGKSWWIKEMRVNHPDLRCFKLPLGSFDRTISAVCKRYEQYPSINCFCIDMTRTMGVDVSLQDMYAAVEEIKGGYLVDMMYGSGKEVYFDPPKIILLHNTDLEKEFQKLKEDGKQHLSADRYIFLQIKDRDKPLCWLGTRNFDLLHKYIKNVLDPKDSCYNT